MVKIPKFLKKSSEALGESWSACMCMMVSGDLTALTVSHALTAARTGGIAAVAVGVTFVLCGKDSKWMMVWAVGLFTMLADLIVHPTHYGPSYAEAALTGLGAALLATVVGRAWTGDSKVA